MINMKKKKYGFTLVELLAVIVVLGIIMAVAGTAAVKIRENANIEEAKKLKKILDDLGPSIYSYEKTVGGSSDFNKKYRKQTFYIGGGELKQSGYIGDIKNPTGSGNCIGYIKVTQSGDFISKICCPGLYKYKSESEEEISSDVECNKFFNHGSIKLTTK